MSKSRKLYVGCGHMVIAGLTDGTPGLYEVQLNGNAEVTCLGFQGTGARAIIDHKNPDRLFVRTGRSGAYRSDDRGRSWKAINEGLVYKEIWSMAQHPRTGELYVGTGPADIFKSDDGGETFQECRHVMTLIDRREWTFPGPPFIPHVKHIGLFDSDPNLVFAAVEEGWLLRSRDAGRTWENLRVGTPFDAHTANIMPDNPQVIVATAGIGAFRSEDGGNRFVESCAGLEQRYLTPLAVHRARPQLLLTAASEVPPPFWRRPEGANAAFYRSDDQGKSWRRVERGLPSGSVAAPLCVASDAEDPDCFYVGMSDGTIWQSEDAAQSFRCVLSGLSCVIGITPASA